MMNTPLKITKLSLNAFRGIPGTIELDLSSPLTLIYAPNGIGKTSCIDAAEWLLTDEIKRLSQFTKRIDRDDLRCKFTLSDIPTKVVAQIEQGTTRFQLSKTFDSWILSNESVTYRTPNAILGALAPTAVDETTDHRTAPKMQKMWLRGTRFLTESDLSTLIDTSPDTKEARRQILSDLMGVRELDDRANEFRKLSEYLRTGYRGEKGITATEKELKDKEGLLKEMADKRKISEDSDATPFRDILRELDLAGIGITGKSPTEIEIKDFQNIEAYRGNLTVKLEVKQKQLEILKEALAFIEIHWPEKDTILTGPKTFTEKEKELKEQFDKIKGDLEKLRNDQVTHHSELNKINQEIKLLFEFSVKLKEGVNAFSLHPERLSNNLQELLQEYGDIPEDGAEREGLLRIVERAKNEFFNIVQICQGNVKLKETLCEIENKLEEKDPQKIRTTLEIAREKSQKAEEKYLSASGPFEQLKFSTKAVMEVIGNTTACPVCAHDWGTSGELKKVLTSTLNQVVPLLVELKNEDAERKRIVSQRESYLRMAEEAMRLRFQLRDNEKSIEVFNQSISALKTYFKKSPLHTPKDFEDFLEKFPQKLSQAALIYELREAIPTLKKFIKQDEQILSLEQLGTMVEETRKTLENKKPKTAELDELIKTKKNELKNLDSEAEAIQTKLLAARSLKNSFMENWNKISGKPVVDDESYVLAKALIKKEKEKVLKADEHLSAIQILMAELSREEDIKALEEEIKSLERRLRRLRSAKVSADKAVKVFEECSINYCREQMEKLSDVIFSIFGRIQTNEIFDRIKGSPEAYEWFAITGDHKFFPSKHFSMGQRQDLALSIFLARTRGLGGTFFLDEPIIHLDDLNRVALLDMLRVLVAEENSNINLVMTTASRSLVRHLQEKFCNLSCINNIPPLRVLELEGTPRTSVRVRAK